MRRPRVQYAWRRSRAGGRSRYITECGHEFHAECLCRWWLTAGKAQCPICRETTRPATTPNPAVRTLTTLEALERASTNISLAYTLYVVSLLTIGAQIGLITCASFTHRCLAISLSGIMLMLNNVFVVWSISEVSTMYRGFGILLIAMLVYTLFTAFSIIVFTSAG